MKKLFTLLLLTGTFMLMSAQQDTVRHLIFTEWRGDQWQNAYMELTNVGDSTLHLDRFTLMSMSLNRTDFSNPNPNEHIRLYGTLEPGETFIGIPVMEQLTATGQPFTRTQVVPMADLLAYRDETGTPGIEHDSISPFDRVFRLWWGTYPSALWYHLDNGDSVVIDAVNNGIRDNGTIGGELWPVAGVAEATWTHILVRKANITRGNTDWGSSRGVSAEDSEWIVIPEDAGGPARPYTTLGVHGDYPISLSSSTIEIDLPNSKITVPWGLWKGDSIIEEFIVGPGMSWYYVERADWEDSTHVINQTGDVLEFYACGNEVEKVNLEIEVILPTDDMALVFPTRWQNEELIWNMRYYVTEEQPGIDTIGNVIYSTRIDSLYSNLEKADNASWEIIFIDGVARPDLKLGDILRVTAANKTTIKDYYIDVQDYMANSNPLLGAITWPDMPGGFFFLEHLWSGDTIPGFTPTSGSYTIKLPYETTQVPALHPMLQNLNASIVSDRATSLSGGFEERTTTFTVTAEDDSTIMVYKVTFMVEKDISKVQEYSPEPFFSEFVARRQHQGCWTEVVNSGNTFLDMSKYMIVMSPNTKNPAEAITEFITTSDEDYNRRFMKYVPGWKYTKDTTRWRENPAMLEYDPNVAPMVNPGDVFSIKRAHVVPGREAYNWQEADVILTPSRSEQDALGRYDYMAVNPWDETMVAGLTAADVFNNNHFLFKIINDSVYNGTKGLTDPEDFLLVDIFADPINPHWTIAGREFSGNDGKHLRVHRKPHVDAGVLTPGVDWGTNMADSDWIVTKKGEDVDEFDDLLTNVGFHEMDPVTKYLSTINSLAYIVSDGFSMEERVRGVVTGTTVDQFYGNIIKADDGQLLVVKRTADGSEMSGTDVLVNSDTLVVTSKDLENMTKYVLEVTAGGLDNNASLTPADGSGYVIDITGEIGNIVGFPYLTTLNTVVDNVIAPASATMNIIDGEGNLVPLQQRNSDTAWVQTQVSDSIFFEVIAENGTTKITYQLKPTALSNDAFVISNVYDVDQDGLDIANIVDNTSVSAFFSNIFPVTGATTKIIDKMQFERTLGTLSYDDRLVVISEDQSTTVEYYLTFFNELNPDAANKAPEVAVLFSDSTLAPDVTISVSANVSDDGQPDPPASLTYLWEVTSGDIGSVTIANEDQVTTDVTFLATGSYVLTLTVDDGDLNASDAITFNVNAVGYELFDLGSIMIYPNPARDVIHVDFGSLSSASQIRIVDLTGKIAYLANHHDSRVEIDANHLEQGIYFMIINVEDQSLVTKINIVK